MSKQKKRGKVNVYAKVEAASKEYAGQAHISLLKGIKIFKARIPERDLYAAWRSGDYSKIMRTIPWDKLPGDLKGMTTISEASAFDAAVVTRQALPPPVDRFLRYDLKNPNIQNLISTRSGRLIVGIQDDALRMVQDAVRNSFTKGWSPRDVADHIKGSVGLYPRQQQALSNYRTGLVSQGLLPPHVDKLTREYENRLLDQRAMMIGRQETRWAANQSQLEVWKAMADQDLIERETCRKVWNVDGNPCDVCAPMDGVAVGLDESWDLDNGDSVDNPSDSHPNCCCGMTLDFTYGEGNDEEDEAE